MSLVAEGISLVGKTNAHVDGRVPVADPALDSCGKERVAYGDASASEIGFADVWPDVAARLRRLLSRRGVNVDHADDYLQEVAVRALSHHVAIVSADDLYRWCAVTCRNLTVDGYRRRRTTVELDDDIAAPGDLGELVETRERLRTAVAAVAALSESDRRVLFGETDPDRRLAARHAVQLHRLRRRLREKLECAAIPAFLVRRGLVSRGDALWPTVEATGALIAGVVLAFGALGLWDAEGPHPPPTRPPAETPASAEPPSAARVGAPSASSGGSGRGHAPDPAPSVVPDLPDQRVTFTAPVGASSGVETRDREVDEPLVCHSSNLLGSTFCTPL